MVGVNDGNVFQYFYFIFQLIKSYITFRQNLSAIYADRKSTLADFYWKERFKPNGFKFAVIQKFYYMLFSYYKTKLNWGSVLKRW
jgi:hypothetical protein